MKCSDTILTQISRAHRKSTILLFLATYGEKPPHEVTPTMLASLVCASFFCLIKIRLRCPCHGAPIIYRETSATDYAWQIDDAQRICLPGFKKKVF